MNPLFSNSQKTASNNPIANNAHGGMTMSNFLKFARNTNPADAKRQVLEMLNNGQISQQDISNAESSARSHGLM